MSLSVKKTYKIINPKNYYYFNEENYKLLSENLTNESLGSFEKQFEISKDIALLSIEMLNNNTYEEVFYLDNDIINKIKVKIDVNIIGYNVFARFEGYSDDKTPILFIGLPKNIKNNLIERLTNAIAHELMHNNVINKRMDNGLEFDDALDIPNHYSIIITMMQNCDEDTILYWYSRSLYVTFFQEVNAIVSQTHIQIFNQLGYKKISSNDEIKRALVKTEPYMIYTTLLNDTLPKLKQMTDEEINNEIVEPYYNFFGENVITIDFVKNSLKKIEKISKKALHNIYRNAMIEGKLINKFLIIL